MTFTKLYPLCCKTEKVSIRLNTINSIFAVHLGAVTNTNNSSLYQVGVRFNQTEQIYVLKSLWRHFIIKDIIRLRDYVFEKHYTYEMIEEELRQNLSYMKQ